jgi:hypothetical protein
MHDHSEPQADGVGRHLMSAADDLPARGVTGRIQRKAPPRVAFAAWLSMISLVGPASRPASSRNATLSASWAR